MPTTTWKENIAPDENALFDRYAEQLRALQKKRARAGAPARALHAKQHLGARAELEIFADVPAHAKHGLFAQPGTYRAYARFSNGAPMHQHDKKADVRGLGIKVLGVEGKQVLTDTGGKGTQDFLFVQSPATPFRTPHEFVAFVRAAATPATLPFRLVASIGLGRTFAIVKALASGNTSKPVATLAGMRFYSALPIRVGPYAARYALEPLQDTDAPLPPERAAGHLAEDLASRLGRGPLSWDMKLQFFEDEARTPIEDASVDWDTPYVTVGRFTVPQQETTSDDGKRTSSLVEKLSFDPWHALVEHTPLGAMMRARKHAYYASVQERGAAPESMAT